MPLSRHWLILFSLLLTFVLAPVVAVKPVHAQSTAGPSEAPILRLETGRHTAPIKGAAVDAQARWIATASYDKTLRLWDGQNGELLRTYRPPLGDGSEGKLYAVAMDPAGEWLAVAGWMGYEWDRKHSIHIVDRASGVLQQRLGGHENVINHLCISADGRWLAAVLGGPNGVRIYDAHLGFREAFADRDYGERSFGCTFSPDSQALVTSSYDGNVRLYRQDGSGFARRYKVKTDGGDEPSGVAFHPDGRRIAVGYSDNTVVSVIDGHSLQPRYRADTEGLGNGSLSSVAWSHDGERLFAGGTYVDGTGNNPVLSWTRQGQGPRRAWSAGDNSVMDLKALPDGGLLAGIADPAVLRFDLAGNKRLDLRPRTVDMRGKRGEHFRLNHDGSQISFGLGYGGESLVWFDIGSRRLYPGDPNTTAQIQARLTELGYDPGAIDGMEGPQTRAAAEAFRRAEGMGGAGLGWRLRQALDISELEAPRTASPELVIEHWRGETNPSLHGEPLAIKQYETSRSLAIAPNGRRFLLGADWRLRLYDQTGKALWQNSVPGAAWGVQISGDNRLAVAAYGDGTIRWYRLSDGEPLLSLFVTNDGEDWVLWTPSGYYDASPGGDRLIGWHVNNGKDALADFYPAAQMRARFYKPEIVAEVLNTLDEQKAVAAAGERPATAVAAGLPPTVELISPGNGERFSNASVTLSYRITSRQNEPVTDLRVLVDGRPWSDARGLGRIKDKPQQMTVILPERDVELSVIAENRFGASVPATASLTWAGQTTRQGEGFIIKPKLYVLAVGVSDYEDNQLDLRYAAKDAGDFASVMQRQGKGLYRDVVVKLLPDADSDAVFDGLDWLRDEVTSKDIAILFLAGHGVNDPDGDYYFLSSDADTERLRRTAIPYFDIKKTLSNLVGKTLAFIDTCHAGNIMGARRGVADINAVINDLSAAENGVVVFASSSGRQYALEDPAWGNGAFTKALVEGISGKADYTGDGKITINQLDLYLSERVKQLTGNKQTPTTTKPHTIADFPIVLAR